MDSQKQLNEWKSLQLRQQCSPLILSQTFVHIDVWFHSVSAIKVFQRPPDAFITLLILESLVFQFLSFTLFITESDTQPGLLRDDRQYNNAR